MKLQPNEAFDRAMAKRRELQGQARAIGVSEAFISDLVDRFYDRIRQNPEIGPVFQNRIQDRWPVHLAKMKTFWTSVALRDGVYEGKPMLAHLGLTEAQPHHFAIWLELFEETLRDLSNNEQIVEFFLGFARAMAARFQSRMFPSVS